jgi:hypothetical protein
MPPSDIPLVQPLNIYFLQMEFIDLQPIPSLQNNMATVQNKSGLIAITEEQ